MKKINYLLAFGACASLLVSCDPETVTTQPAKEKTKTEMLTGGKWQMSASESTYVVDGVETKVNEYAAMEACDKDDFMLLATDGTATWDEGPTKCDVNNTQTSTGKWAFIENETKIVWEDQGYKDTASIDQLTEVTLKINYTSVTDEKNSEKTEQTFTLIN